MPSEVVLLSKLNVAELIIGGVGGLKGLAERGHASTSNLHVPEIAVALAAVAVITMVRAVASVR
jgi:hypothetical protein